MHGASRVYLRSVGRALESWKRRAPETGDAPPPFWLALELHVGDAVEHTARGRGTIVALLAAEDAEGGEAAVLVDYRSGEVDRRHVYREARWATAVRHLPAESLPRNRSRAGTTFLM